MQLAGRILRSGSGKRDRSDASDGRATRRGTAVCQRPSVREEPGPISFVREGERLESPFDSEGGAAGGLTQGASESITGDGERWKAVPGCGDLYEVSDHGRVRSRVGKNGLP